MERVSGRGWFAFAGQSGPIWRNQDCSIRIHSRAQSGPIIPLMLGSFILTYEVYRHQRIEY